jgi:uncharacterized protein (TIGR02246 family)
MSDTARVAAVVESWRQAFEASDAEGLKALWAQTHPGVTYQPTERETPLTSFSEISDYYDQACTLLRSKAWRIWDVQVDVLSPDTAFAFALMDMLVEANDPQQPGEHYWQGRVSFVLTKRDGDWKIVHYEDSTLNRYLVTAAQRVQRPSLEKCISLIQAGQPGPCLPLLVQLMEPISSGDLSRANQAAATDPAIR